MADLHYNPWAGLDSYQDPATSKVHLKFCGRDEESFDVAQLIEDNIFVTLYGMSGTGKTSLLNAGVFDRLRKKQYFPIRIRLSMDSTGMSFQECIEKRLLQAFSETGSIETREVVSLPDDRQSVEFLWSFFARNRFRDSYGRICFPVLVFDQFEEVFQGRRANAESLLRQIHFMMDESHALKDRIIDGKPYSYDFNFRFVVSLREDDLFRLEDSIDTNYLSELKRCRYRLRNLSEKGARDAILQPGEGLFLPEEQEVIVNKILGSCRYSNGNRISANILSLICHRIYMDFKQGTKEKFITLTLVESFIKDNPFERFYEEATKNLSDKEKSYIEDSFIDSSGNRRNSVLEEDFFHFVPKGDLLLSGEYKILQRTSVSSDGNNCRIELIHDSFCKPLATYKERREKRKRIRWIIRVAIFVLFSIGGYSLYLYRELKSEDSINTEQIEQLRLENDSLKRVNEQLRQAQ